MMAYGVTGYVKHPSLFLGFSHNLIVTNTSKSTMLVSHPLLLRGRFWQEEKILRKFQTALEAGAEVLLIPGVREHRAGERGKKKNRRKSSRHQ